LSPRDGDVEALGVGEEAERETLVDLEVLFVGADGRDDDNAVRERERKRDRVSAKSEGKREGR